MGHEDEADQFVAAFLAELEGESGDNGEDAEKNDAIEEAPPVATTFLCLLSARMTPEKCAALSKAPTGICRACKDGRSNEATNTSVAWLYGN